MGCCNTPLVIDYHVCEGREREPDMGGERQTLELQLHEYLFFVQRELYD
jgi:hypothetical protein